MNLKCLRDPIKEKLSDIVTEFHKDIEATQNVCEYILILYHILLLLLLDPLLSSQLYSINYKNPVIDLNMPPITGRIHWARQLLFHLEQPMNILKEYQSVIQSFPNTKLLYKKYNKTALVLTEYELSYHKAWIKFINEGQKHLQVSVL